MTQVADLLVTMTKQQLEALLLDAMHKVSKVSEPEVLTVKQTAELFDVHPRTLMQKLVRERGCPVHYVGPQDPRFRRSEVLEWLSKQPKELASGGS